jgi:hypothetical protein
MEDTTITMEDTTIFYISIVGKFYDTMRYTMGARRCPNWETYPTDLGKTTEAGFDRE